MSDSNGRRQRLIIVDGPDGSGKTTLTTRIAERLGMGLQVFSYKPTRPGFATTFDEYLSRLNRSELYEVWDRCWWDEWVYRDLGSPEPKPYNMGEYRHLLWQTIGHDPLVIWCTQSIRNEDEYVTGLEQSKAMNRYVSLMPVLSLFVRMVTYSAQEWHDNVDGFIDQHLVTEG